MCGFTTISGSEKGGWAGLERGLFYGLM